MIRGKRARPALFFLLVFAATAHAQQEREDRLRFGALRFGMSLDEARAASPETQWTVVDRHVLRGARAVTLAGMGFDLEMGARGLGARSWTLESSATTRGASECEARTLALIGELEGRFGEFHEPDRLMPGESKSSAGKSSSAVVSSAGPAKSWVRSLHVPTGPDDLEVRVGADYERRTCRVEVRIASSPPAPERKDFATLQLLAQPTISYRNRSLRNVGVPSETLHFSIPCVVDATSGKISQCLRTAGDADPHRALAVDWAMDFQFKPEPGHDDERMIAIEIPVQMGPADVRTVNAGSGPPLDLTQVRVKRTGAPSLPNLDLQAPLDVPVTCEVMEDGSLICALKPGTAVPAAIAAAAVHVAEQMQLELTLRDGTSAVGGHIERKVTFKPGR